LFNISLALKTPERKHKMDNKYLLDLVSQKVKQAWIGGLPPFNMDIIDMEGCTNFRVAPHFHGQYDVVWLYEKELQNYHVLSWKIILDEAIRLLKEQGQLVVHMHQSRYMTIPMLKHFFGRHVNLEVDVDYESKENNVFVFKIKRLNFTDYQSDLWTFAMLTGGKKDEIVIKFLESIRRHDPKNRHEIIISGPKKEIYDKYHVKYLDLSQFRDAEYAEISKKKNAIADMAKNPNLLIAHDRYYLEDDFFEQFEKYGYDWDFLACRQCWPDGHEFPFYCALYEPALTWTHPINCHEYAHLLDNQYVNGGAMIFKTKTLQKLRFNSLIFWNEMEDVEITHTFMQHSIIPRVNYLSTLVTIQEKSSRAASFDLFDQYDGNKMRHKVKGVTRSDRVFGVGASGKKRWEFFIGTKKKFPFIRLHIRRR